MKRNGTGESGGTGMECGCGDGNDCRWKEIIKRIEEYPQLPFAIICNLCTN